MSETRECRSCSAEVPANAPFGHCPKCLLDLGFGSLPEGVEPSPGELGEGKRVFGDYELLEQIGRGGMGVVYKARQLALNRLVALKLISAGEFASPVLIQRFHREAEAAANLSHPNIVPIYETGEIRGNHYLSMALIRGMGLDDYIKRSWSHLGSQGRDARSVSRLRQEEIARMLAKVARAVDHAHQHGVLHRDLKPGNIIVDKDGEPHLTDFGVAKMLGSFDSSLTASGAILGTPSYMAPEQAAGQSKNITTAADVYSLGALLYAMLTGSPPFRGDTPVETLRQVVEQEPKHPSTLKEGIDSDLATIAMKCLEKEPARRYASASAVADDLERWIRKEPIQARPTHTAERFWRWCRRNPKEAVLGGSVALLLVLLALGATISATYLKIANAEARQSRDQLQNATLADLDALFMDEHTKLVPISSALRRTLAGKPPVAQAALQLRFVEHIYVHPRKMLGTLSPILDELEESLSRRLQTPVAIEMQLLKSPTATYAAMESGQPVFARMGPASFVQLLDRSNGVRLLAAQDHKKDLTMALVARADSKIARLAKSQPDVTLSALLANCSLALSHSNSTTGSYLPKQFLALNGVFATNLSRYTHLGSQESMFAAVTNRNFDVGAGNLELLDDFPTLQVIKQFNVPTLGRTWVAGKGLDVAVEQHLQASLLGMSDPAILRKLESDVRGFKLFNAATLEQVRVIIRESALFDK